MMLLVAALTLQGADLLLEYSFNDSSPTTDTTVDSLWDWPLAFQAQDGTPADWHGALGSGVSGLPADRAFDNSAATAMGSGGEGGRAFGVSQNSTLLDSVTLSGWFRTAAEPIGSFTRLFFWDGFTQVYGYPENTLYFSAGGWRDIGSTAAYTETNEWVFFAVTFDGTQSADNVKFWKGTRTHAVSLVVTRSLPAGPFNPGGYGQFAIGNNYHNSSPIQPFAGWLDNFRLHGGSGSSGVLEQADLEALRTADVAGVLPPLRLRVRLDSTFTVGPPASLTFGWWSVLGYAYQVERSSNLATWTDQPGMATSGDGSYQMQVLSSPPAFRMLFRLRITPASP